MIPVEGHNGLYRDEKSNAIINMDDKAYNEYLNSKNKLIEDRNRLSQLEDEIQEIKQLLIKLLENK